MMKRALAVLTLTAAIGAVGNASAQNNAPEGLRWGMSPDSARQAMTQHFSFVEADTTDTGTLYQRYAGAFLGLDTEAITAAFVRDSLLMVSVQVALGPDQLPGDKWQNLLRALGGAHGAPDTLLSRRRGGRMQPMAQWDLGGNAELAAHPATVHPRPGLQRQVLAVNYVYRPLYDPWYRRVIEKGSGDSGGGE